MRKQMEKTVSAWMATCEPPAYGGLTEDIETDVCVVGAGIAGLTTAYLLLKEGRQVVVIESRHIGAGQTQRTTAHLVNAHDDFFSEIEKMYGEAGIRVAAESHTAAIARIERIVQDEQIDCDFRRIPGYLFCPPGQSGDILDKELDAATRAGITGLEIVGRVPLASFDTGKALRYPNQGEFHPLKYLTRLAEIIEAAGGKIYTGTAIKQVKD
jgi:glycine/D-amino acid oxidase-like deaminating enzyme